MFTHSVVRTLASVAVCCAILPTTGGAQINDDNASILLPRELAKRQGDNRPEGQYQTGFFGRPLTIGGEYEFNPEMRRNLALQSNGGTEDKFSRVEQKLELEAFFDAGNNWYVFAETKLGLRQDVRNDGDDERQSSLERGELWVYYHLPRHHLGIQVGRQSFKDKREWFWDADLDAIRLRYEKGDWRGELAIAQELAGVSSQDKLDPAEKDVTRIIGNVQWRWADRQTFDVFWLSHADNSSTPASGEIFTRAQEDESDADLMWFGARGRGTFKIKPLGRFYYWADLATVSGDERLVDFDGTPDGLRVVDDFEDFNIDGTAFDIGATWRWESDRLGDTYFTASLARGSGDSDPDDDSDKAFRQTGLQDNNGKFRGVDRFRYYGELFRPELSNLQVTTLSVGRRLWSGSSIELAYHSYRQLTASTELRDSRIEADPTGLARQLGQELDLVFGLEESVHLEVELVGAVFRSGRAFGTARNQNSFALALKANYNF